MLTSDDHHSRGRAGSPSVATADRRRPSLAELSFAPDPRRLRDLLAEFELALGSSDPALVRRARLLVGEIVARVLAAGIHDEIQLDLQIMSDSVRIDIWQDSDGPCDFWDRLDDAVFSDLASAWGRDRRRECGAWFEIENPARR